MYSSLSKLERRLQSSSTQGLVQWRHRSKRAYPEMTLVQAIFRGSYSLRRRIQGSTLIAQGTMPSALLAANFEWDSSEQFFLFLDLIDKSFNRM